MNPEISVNGHKLKLNVRDVVQFVVTALSIVGIYFLSSNRISNVEVSVLDLYKLHAALIISTADMDKNGTHRSHETDATQQQAIEQHTAQINEINHTLRDLSPKVDKIDTNVLWLMAKQLERK